MCCSKSNSNTSYLIYPGRYQLCIGLVGIQLPWFGALQAHTSTDPLSSLHTYFRTCCLGRAGRCEQAAPWRASTIAIFIKISQDCLSVVGTSLCLVGSSVPTVGNFTSFCMRACMGTCRWYDRTSPNYSIAKDDEATKTNAAAVSRPLLSGRI